MEHPEDLAAQFEIMLFSLCVNKLKGYAVQ
jgi:hypothetical protein